MFEERKVLREVFKRASGCCELVNLLMRSAFLVADDESEGNCPL